MYQRLLAKGVPAEKAFLFPNWADIDSIKPLLGPSKFKQELGLTEDTIVALYSGNMGEKQGLDIILEAALLLRGQPNIIFVMCGAGSYLLELKNKAKSYQLSNILWLPLQPIEKLNELLNMAAIHLLPQKPDVEDQVMPSKLLGMLASGRAILATAFPGSQLYDVVKAVGVVSQPGDAKAFADNIDKLAQDGLQRLELGQKGRAYVEEHFAKEAVLNRYEARLNQLVLDLL
jgi:colanic acid biosynthesis glycosyl transferase WcaI